MKPTAKTSVSDSTVATPSTLSATAREYFELTKPKVVALIVFTAVVGMFLSTPTILPLWPFVWGTLGIALAAG